MSKEAMKLALEALEAGEYYIDDLEAIVYASDDLGTHEDRAKMQAAITVLQEELAKPDFWEGYVPEPVKPAQQEPVAYQVTAYGNTQAFIKRADVADETASRLRQQFDSYADVTVHPLYTSPPAQRKPPQFPTMLRKMWSSAEVQKWINENWEQT